MKVDEIITLEDGKSYGLLLESKQNGFKYFLSVMLNEKEEPTDSFKVFKEINENNEIAVIEEENPIILKKLVEDYYAQLEDIE